MLLGIYQEPSLPTTVINENRTMVLISFEPLVQPHSTVQYSYTGTKTVWGKEDDTEHTENNTYWKRNDLYTKPVTIPINGNDSCSVATWLSFKSID